MASNSAHCSLGPVLLFCFDVDLHFCWIASAEYVDFVIVVVVVVAVAIVVVVDLVVILEEAKNRQLNHAKDTKHTYITLKYEVKS